MVRPAVSGPRHGPPVCRGHRRGRHGGGWRPRQAWPRRPRRQWETLRRHVADVGSRNGARSARLLRPLARQRWSERPHDDGAVCRRTQQEPCHRWPTKAWYRWSHWLPARDPRWTRPERPRPGASGPRVLTAPPTRTQRARRDESGVGHDGSPNAPRTGETGTAACSRRQGSPASAECPRRPGRYAGPCGSAGWDGYRRRPAARRRRTGTQTRRCAPAPPTCADARADARRTPAAQWRSDAGEPCGSSAPRAATPSGLRGPIGRIRRLGAFLSECLPPLPEALPEPRAAVDGSASAGRAERRGEPMGSER